LYPLIKEYRSYLEHNKGRSPLTCDQYSRALARLASFLNVQGKDLMAADLKDLEAFSGEHLQKQGVGRRSRALYITAIKGFYAWLWKGLGKNSESSPAKGLVYPLKGFPLPRSMKLESAGKLLSQQDLEILRGLRDTAMLMLLLGCGLRVSELVGLNESDLIWTPDPAGGLPDLDLRVIGKGVRERLVSVPKEAGLAVRAYLGHEELGRIDRQLPKGDRVLFVSLASSIRGIDYYGERRRIHRCSVYRMMRAYGEAAGIPAGELHPHALRHLFATHLLDKGADLFSIQQLLGHVSLETTKVYLHMTPGRRRELVNQKSPLASIGTPFRSLARQLDAKG
jgi:integrase/recombinase XerD